MRQWRETQEAASGVKSIFTDPAVERQRIDAPPTPQSLRETMIAIARKWGLTWNSTESGYALRIPEKLPQNVTRQID